MRYLKVSEGNESVPETNCRLEDVSYPVAFSQHAYRDSSEAACAHTQE